jgi:hypothetical protein
MIVDHHADAGFPSERLSGVGDDWATPGWHYLSS